VNNSKSNGGGLAPSPDSILLPTDRSQRELTQSQGSPTASIILIEQRTLFRECLTYSLTVALGPAVISFSSVNGWVEVMDQLLSSVVILSTGGKSAQSVQRDIGLLNRVASHLPIILLDETEEPDQVVQFVERGAVGYLATDVSLAVAIEAMRLVKAGGLYVPARSLIALSRNKTNATGNRTKNHGFTRRQADVLRALRQGKPNKIIAHELCMRESTVKVHVRNIMRKVKATNRTEVAFMTREWALEWPFKKVL
jgi:DNA-binding NarL/FixJ family response regulator